MIDGSGRGCVCVEIEFALKIQLYSEAIINDEAFDLVYRELYAMRTEDCLTDCVLARFEFCIPYRMILLFFVLI